MSERHVFIVPGISREAFTAAGQRATAADSDLTFYVHEHRHDPYGGVPCNSECTVIQRGIIAHNVVDITLMDDAETNQSRIS